MNLNLNKVAAVILAASIAGSCAWASDATPPQKHKTKKAEPAGPSVQDQIDGLRHDLQGQIDSLKSDLAAKDAQLRQAQQQAADAQAAAAKAAADASASASDNAAAVGSLQTTVNDLKANQASLATTVSDETTKIKQSIESPNVLHYKGITLTPGGFVAAETVWRAHSTGADIPTPFTALPNPSAQQYHMSEFYATSRQSRISLLAEGKTNWGTMKGYWEADWLGTGITSNNNQSNSYVLRQRIIWGQAALNNGWAFTGGQLWSLATEDAKGLSNLSGDIMTPQTIDPNYNPGFVWTRQYGFRVTKSFSDKFAAGIAIENPQTLKPGGGGKLNAGISYVYANVGSGSGLTNTGGTYSTSGGIGQATQYDANATPDFIVKAAFDPGLGHYEVFGIARSFRDRVYDSNANTATNNTVWGGGIGASVRVPVKHIVDLGVKGLWGTGTGRYGDSTIADVTVKPDGTFEPLKALSALGTVEVHAGPRLLVYANYGGDYIGKVTYYTNAATPVASGYGYPGSEVNTNCAESFTVTVPGIAGATSSTCTGNARDVQEGTVGYWYDFYRGPKGRLRQGIQYSYTTLQIWQNQTGYAPKAIEQGLWTSFRYYLP